MRLILSLVVGSSLLGLGCGAPAVAPATSGARAHVGVRLYTTRWCPHCERARRWLRSRGIPYEELDVEASARAAAQHRALDPNRTVPVIAIEGGGVMVGFVPDELRRRIDRAAHARCAAQPDAPGC